MAHTINVSGRIIQKHDVLENWKKAINFIPLEGEIIVYDDILRIKIGDGIKTVNELEFSDNKVFIQTEEPAQGIQVGDLWFDGENLIPNGDEVKY